MVSFLPMNLLCLWPMFLLEVVCTSAIILSGVFPNPMDTCLNAFTSRIQADILESLVFPKN